MQEDREAAEAIAARLQAAMPGCSVRPEAWEGAPGYWWVVVRDVAGAADACLCGEGLTGRERAVPRPAALGLQEGEIGARPGMARTTVHHHVKASYARLGVRCRAYATGHALRLGIATPEELVAAAEAASAAYGDCGKGSPPTSDRPACLVFM